MDTGFGSDLKYVNIKNTRAKNQNDKQAIKQTNKKCIIKLFYESPLHLFRRKWLFYVDVAPSPYRWKISLQRAFDSINRSKTRLGNVIIVHSHLFQM